MSANDVRAAYLAAIDGHEVASSKANIKKTINDADAHIVAEALTDGLASDRVALRLGMYKISREQLKEARAVSEAAWEKYQVAKKAYDEVMNRPSEETA